MAVFSIPSRALTIVPTFDSTVTGLANAAQVEAAFSNAMLVIETLYTNPITVNITVWWGTNGALNPFANGISLGRSQVEMVGYANYSDMVDHLRAARTTAYASNAVASLPASDPIPNGSSWLIPRAEAKALNFTHSIVGGTNYSFGISQNDSWHDGDVGFASDAAFTFSATNRAVFNEWDFIAVAEHEITEVLGRSTYDLGTYTYFVPYDLFRFTNSAGRTLNVNDSGVYFSIDNGVTALKFFYNDVTTGDIQDWADSTPGDAFDAYVYPGNRNILSSADLIALNVIGYALNYSPPVAAGQKSGGTFALTLTNPPGLGLSVIETTNLAAAQTNWTNLGPMTENPAGQYQFTDTQATNGARFYRVSLK